MTLRPGNEKLINATPAVSVVIASYHSESTIDGTLRSLTNQRFAGDYEVLVVDSSEDDVTAEVVRRFPQVRLIRVRGRRYPGEARNIGVRESRCEILAFTDADCSVGREWVAAISSLHQGNYRIVGGTIANGNPDQLVGWLYYFCKFHNWLPCQRSSNVKEIPTTCLSMHRKVFDRYGPFLQECYSSDSAFNWKAHAELGKACLSPEIEVRHTNYNRLSTVVSKLYLHGRDFARLRVREEHWSRPRAALYVMALPLLPLVLFGKALLRVFSSGVYVQRFIALAPFVLCGFTIWSLGETIGYLDHLRLRYEPSI